MAHTFNLDTLHEETTKFPTQAFPMDQVAQTAKTIALQLIENGHTALFAGGSVRDQILNKTPKDYDIATSATPQEVLDIFPGSDPIGAHFGVILVKKNKTHFEVATFRNDGSYSDSRRPDTVTFSNPQEDAERRDFTVNGLFQNPATGEIIDYVNGQQDLETKTLRAIGNPQKRFNEDALRLMRAIRFATTLDFQIEPDTWQAIIDNHHLLENIAIERIRDELNKILLHPNRARGLKLLVDSNLIDHIIPEVRDLIGCEQPPQFHPEGDVFTHTSIMLDMLEPDPSLPLVLSVLLHDIGKPATYTYDPEEDRIRFNGHDGLGAEMSEQILKRLKYSNDTIEAVVPMVANHMNFMHVTVMKKSKLKRFMARPTYQDEMQLHRVDCASSNGITENFDFLRQKEIEFANEPLIPEPLLTGKDLINLGYQPGPTFKKILTDLQTHQLEGTLKTKQEALHHLKKNFPQ